MDPGKSVASGSVLGSPSASTRDISGASPCEARVLPAAAGAPWGLCGAEAASTATVTAKPRSQQALNFQLGLDLRIKPDLSMEEAG